MMTQSLVGDGFPSLIGAHARKLTTDRRSTAEAKPTPKPTPKAKVAAKPKAIQIESDDESDVLVKPKAPTKKKVTAVVDSDDDSDAPVPKPKAAVVKKTAAAKPTAKAAPAKKAPVKTKKKAVDSDSDGDDFGASDECVVRRASSWRSCIDTSLTFAFHRLPSAMDLDDEPVPARTSPRNKRATAKKAVAQYIDLYVHLLWSIRRLPSLPR
jgi:hypothetical protein